MNFLLQRIQDAMGMLCISLYVARNADETTQLSGEVACDDLSRRLTGKLPDNVTFDKSRSWALGSQTRDDRKPKE